MVFAWYKHNLLYFHIRCTAVENIHTNKKVINLNLLEHIIAFLYIILTKTYFQASMWEDFVVFWEVSLILFIVKYRNEISHVVDMIYRIEYRLMNTCVTIYRVLVHSPSFN